MRAKLPKITEEEMKELEKMPLEPTEKSIPVDCEVSPLGELKKIPTTEWARIWCELNSWIIPKELEHIKPKWWVGNNIARAMNFLRPIMQHIETTIGMKACNRYWNKDNMTDEEHEIFYRNNFLGDKIKAG